MRTDATLYVVTAIFNPFRYQAHYSNYRRFAAHMAASGAHLVTIELGFADRPFVVTESGNPNHIQVRGNSELWLKENLLNLAVQRLPPGWKYVAWIDSDIEFSRADWAQETIEHLQHYSVVQPWSDAYDLGPQQQHLGHYRSFCRQYLNGAKWGDGEYWHSGFSWSMTRQAWDHLGGLLDTCIVGSADYHMAHALVGRVDRTYGVNPVNGLDGYAKRLVRWQDSAEAHIRRNIGYVEGSIRHFWHGPKGNRKYVERWSILHRNGFDPDLDLKRNSYGVFELTGRSIGLRDDLRAYFRERNDDQNTLGTAVAPTAALATAARVAGPECGKPY
jgi:hypothetical protein